MPQQKHTQSDVERWTVEDVVQWLTSVKLTDCKDYFNQRNFTGHLLLQVTDEEIKTFACLPNDKKRKQFKKALAALPGNAIKPGGGKGKGKKSKSKAAPQQPAPSQHPPPPPSSQPPPPPSSQPPPPPPPQHPPPTSSPPAMIHGGPPIMDAEEDEVYDAVPDGWHNPPIPVPLPTVPPPAGPPPPPSYPPEQTDYYADEDQELYIDPGEELDEFEEDSFSSEDESDYEEPLEEELVPQNKPVSPFLSNRERSPSEANFLSIKAKFFAHGLKDHTGINVVGTSPSGSLRAQSVGSEGIPEEDQGIDDEIYDIPPGDIQYGEGEDEDIYDVPELDEIRASATASKPEQSRVPLPSETTPAVQAEEEDEDNGELYDIPEDVIAGMQSSVPAPPPAPPAPPPPPDVPPPPIETEEIYDIADPDPEPPVSKVGGSTFFPPSTSSVPRPLLHTPPTTSQPTSKFSRPPLKKPIGHGPNSSEDSEAAPPPRPPKPGPPESIKAHEPISADQAAERPRLPTPKSADQKQSFFSRPQLRAPIKTQGGPPPRPSSNTKPAWPPESQGGPPPRPSSNTKPAWPPESQGGPPQRPSSNTKPAWPPESQGGPPPRPSSNTKPAWPPESQGGPPPCPSSNTKPAWPPVSQEEPPPRPSSNTKPAWPPVSQEEPPPRPSSNTKPAWPPESQGGPPPRPPSNTKPALPSESQGGPPPRPSSNTKPAWPPGSQGGPPPRPSSNTKPAWPPGSQGGPPSLPPSNTKPAWPPGSQGGPPPRPSSNTKPTWPPGSQGGPPSLPPSNTKPPWPESQKSNADQRSPPFHSSPQPTHKFTSRPLNKSTTASPPASPKMEKTIHDPSDVQQFPKPSMLKKSSSPAFTRKAIGLKEEIKLKPVAPKDSTTSKVAENRNVSHAPAQNGTVKAGNGPTTQNVTQRKVKPPPAPKNAKILGLLKQFENKSARDEEEQTSSTTSLAPPQKPPMDKSPVSGRKLFREDSVKNLKDKYEEDRKSMSPPPEQTRNRSISPEEKPSLPPKPGSSGMQFQRKSLEQSSSKPPFMPGRSRETDIKPPRPEQSQMKKGERLPPQDKPVEPLPEEEKPAFQPSTKAFVYRPFSERKKGGRKSPQEAEKVPPQKPSQPDIEEEKMEEEPRIPQEHEPPSREIPRLPKPPEDPPLPERPASFQRSGGAGHGTFRLPAEAPPEPPKLPTRPRPSYPPPETRGPPPPVTQVPPPPSEPSEPMLPPKPAQQINEEPAVFSPPPLPTRPWHSKNQNTEASQPPTSRPPPEVPAKREPEPPPVVEPPLPPKPGAQYGSPRGCSWYHADLDRKRAEIKLKKYSMKDGTFIVRDSTKVKGEYSLSLLFGGGIRHLRIRLRTDKKYVLGEEKDDELAFDTVVELVEYHKGEPLVLRSGGETTLKYECPP